MNTPTAQSCTDHTAEPGLYTPEPLPMYAKHPLLVRIFKSSEVLLECGHLVRHLVS